MRVSVTMGAPTQAIHSGLSLAPSEFGVNADSSLKPSVDPRRILDSSMVGIIEHTYAHYQRIGEVQGGVLREQLESQRWTYPDTRDMERDNFGQKRLHR